MTEETEQNWVERAKNGEASAIAELYRRYWRAARATAFGVTGDFALAEDAASESFYAALDHLKELRDNQRFAPWLRTIVIRTASRLKATKSKEKGIEEGHFGTSYELMQRKTNWKKLKEQMHQRNKLSDTLFLWKRPAALELRDIEDLLRHLAEVVTPETPVRFCQYEEPRYRTGLRMQIGNNAIPAAIGGVHTPWPGLPKGACFASVLIYLEPWATARSGQVIEFEDFSPSDFFNHMRKQDS